MWYPSIFNCECDKTCGIAKYIGIQICKRIKGVTCSLVLTCEDEI